jgi:hypothetical protein
MAGDDMADTTFGRAVLRAKSSKNFRLATSEVHARCPPLRAGANREQCEPVMPKPSTQELFIAALYLLTAGEPKSRLVAVVARELDITFEAAEELASDCARRGWLEHVAYAVALREEGLDVARKVLEAASVAAPEPKAPTPRKR